MRDVRDALRSLRAAPAFALVALSVLALGTGATTLIFSMVDAVVLRALPFPDSNRIVAVGSLYNGRPGLETAPTFVEWRERQRAFESFAAIAAGTMTLNGKSDAEEVRLERITADFFDVLRVRPAIGQPFKSNNEDEGNDGVAIISNGLWRSHYGADPNIVGKPLQSSIGVKIIVGVMPADFAYPVEAARSTDVWVPYVIPAKDRHRATADRTFVLQLLARLKPGITVPRAQALMQQLTEPVAAQHPKWFGATGIVGVTPLRDLVVGDVRSWLLMLLGAVAVVLLLASVNVAGLMLAHGRRGGRQLAVRTALGASRFRIIRGVLAESLALTALGSVGGLILAWLGMATLRAAIPVTVPRVSSIALDSRVLSVAVLVSVTTAIAVAIVPAGQASRTNLFDLLKDSERSTTSGRRSWRIHGAMVVAEIGLTVVLLVGAGLFIASFRRLVHVDLGFDYRRVLTIALAANSADVTWNARGGITVNDIVGRLKTVRGVESVAAISQGQPLIGLRHRVDVHVPSDTAGTDSIELRAVSADYFEVLRIPIVRGRPFIENDRADGRLVAVLSEEASRKYFRDSNPLGASIVIDGRVRTVVGVARGVRLGGPEADIVPLAYEPLLQSASVRNADLVIRTVGDPLAILPMVKSQVWSLDPQLPVRNPTSLETLFDRLAAVRRFNMLLVSLFGIVGLAVAAAGIYGVVAFEVAERTREIAIRMALGAQRSQVMWNVLTSLLGYLALGLAIGATGAAALARVIKAFLFEVQPFDLVVYELVVLTLVAAGLMAAWPQARRAATIDPLISLKQL